MDSKLLNSIKAITPIMPGGFYWKNADCVYQGCNDSFLTLAGLTNSQEIVGKTDFDMPWKSLANRIRDNDLKILSTGEQQSLEEEFTLSDGKKVALLFSKSAIKDENGIIIGILGIINSFKDKALEEPKPYTKNQLQIALESIMDNIPAHIFWKDRNCILLECNNLQAINMGFSSGKEMVGKNNYDVIWPNQPKEARQAQADAITQVDLRVMNEGIDYVVEEPLILPNGTTAIYLSRKTPLRNEKGEIIGLLGIAFDITSQKKAEALTKEKALMEEKIQGMKTLAASVAHELRTPLRSVNLSAMGIKKYLPVLLEAYQLAKKEKLPVQEIEPFYYDGLLPALKRIDSESQEAFNIIDMLLINLDHTHNPLAPKSIKPLSIKHCVEEALRRYFFDLGEKDLVHLQDMQNFTFNGDEMLIIHILFNLLKNALYQIKATKKGDIHIRTELGSDYNKLYFKDTAKGIAPEALPHIFDQFFTTTYHGTGIGLAFCKMVMEGLGGKITCQSELGKYAEFVLYFPTDN